MKSNSEFLKKSKTKRIIVNILCLFITVVFICGLCELFIRIYLPIPKNAGNLVRKEWNRDYKKSAFIPNTEAIHSGIPVTINSVGLKNKEIDISKTEGVMRISMFGDSLVFGQGLKINETLSSQLEREWNKDKAWTVEVQVLNFGVCGMNTFQEMMYALNYGSQFNPDIVMLIWTYNDIEMNGYTLEDFEFFKTNYSIPLHESVNSVIQHAALGKNVGSFKGKESFTIYFWNFYAELKTRSRFIDFIGARTKELMEKFGLHFKTSEKVIYGDTNSDGFKLSFSSLKYAHDEFINKGIEFYVILYPVLLSLGNDYYNDLINKKVEEYCKTNNIDYLNLFSFFKGKDPSALHVSTVDIHPNKYANEIASKTIMQYLQQKSKHFSGILAE